MGCGASQHVNSVESLVTRLKEGNSNDRRNAAIDLETKSTDDVLPHVDKLAAALLDPDLEVRNRAGKALVSISKKGRVTESPHAVFIAELLWHDDYKIRSTAQDTLEGLEQAASLAIPQLTIALSKDGDARFRSLNVLLKIGSKASSSASEIAKCLSDKAPQTCKVSEQALIQFKENGVSALPELSRMLKVEDSTIVLRALRVLHSMGAVVGGIASDLVSLLRSSDEDIRNSSRKLVQQLGENAGSAAPALARLCSDRKESGARLIGAEMLGCLGTCAGESTPVLASLLRDGNEAVRQGAVESLIKLHDHSSPAVSEFAALLKSPMAHSSEHIWISALKVLEQSPVLAAPLAAAIAGGLAHDSMEVRDLVVAVLDKIACSDNASAAVPIVTGFMKHESTSVRYSAANAIKKMNMKTSSGAADLAKLLADDRYDVQRKALETIEELGPQAGGAAPDIAMLLAHDKEEVRDAAAKALDLLGSQAIPALMQLLSLLTHRKEHVRSTASRIIRSFGRSAVLEFDKKLQENKDWKLRRRIVEQVSKLGGFAAPFVHSIAGLLEDESLELQIIVATFFRDLQDIPGVVPPDILQRSHELMESMLQYHVPPAHWCNHSSEFDEMLYVDRKHHDKFNRLLKDTYLPKCTQDRPCPTGIHSKTKGGCACVQLGGDPGLPVEYLVHRVVRVENALKWARYVGKRSAIRVKRAAEAEPFRQFDPPILSSKAVDECPEVFAPLEHDLNEVYLFHGTFVRATLSIAKLDFNIDLAGSSTGTMYGAGAYLGESITKADEYAKDEPGGYYDGVYAALLCRTCMGKLYYTTKRDCEAGDKVVGGSFDSTCGDRSKSAGTFRELVIYDNDQLYPEYIVFYKRVHSRDDYPGIVRELACPLHLETPAYWSNCHKLLAGNGFNERYEVSLTTFGGLQRLVNACLTNATKYELVRAYCVENAKLWQAYVDFKVGLRRRISKHLDSQAGKVTTSKHLEQERHDQALSLESIETDINEYWLWHATSEEHANLIAQNNFSILSIDEATTLRFGNGAYFAETLDKASAYSMDAGGYKFLLLCRVVCGEIYYTDEETNFDATKASHRCGKDSVLADPSKQGPREFVALRSEQIYPEFILVVGKA